MQVLVAVIKWQFIRKWSQLSLIVMENEEISWLLEAKSSILFLKIT